MTASQLFNLPINCGNLIRLESCDLVTKYDGSANSNNISPQHNNEIGQ